MNHSSNASVLSKYMSLDQPENCVLLTYVWHDSYNYPDDTRSKTRIVDFVPNDVDDIPIWSFAMPLVVEDGSDTSIEYVLKPVAMYKDPFRPGNNNSNNKLVWCETMTFDDKPSKYNSRNACVQVLGLVSQTHDPWFGFEQEFVLMQGNRPYNWPLNGSPPTGDYLYLGAVGPHRAFGRDVMEAHMAACIYAGVHLFGTVAEGMPSQWEYQCGPDSGIKCADDVWISRHILSRIAEDFGISVSFDPRVVPNWPGSGGHMNYSTKEMRSKNGGLDAIKRAIDCLRSTHDQDVMKYDVKDNSRRLTGGMCNSNLKNFTVSIGLRNTSIRIPTQVHKDGYGYLEDRRPAANCDPYIVIQSIVTSTLLSGN